MASKRCRSRAIAEGWIGGIHPFDSRTSSTQTKKTQLLPAEIPFTLRSATPRSPLYRDRLLRGDDRPGAVAWKHGHVTHSFPAAQHHVQTARQCIEGTLTMELHIGRRTKSGTKTAIPRLNRKMETGSRRSCSTMEKEWYLRRTTAIQSTMLRRRSKGKASTLLCTHSSASRRKRCL